MLGERENQLFFTRAALITGGRAKRKFRSVINNSMYKSAGKLTHLGQPVNLVAPTKSLGGRTYSVAPAAPKQSGAVRIYDIAKKLGLETRQVLAKARELEIAAKVPSSALDRFTAERLEAALRE